MLNCYYPWSVTEESGLLDEGQYNVIVEVKSAFICGTVPFEVERSFDVLLLKLGLTELSASPSTLKRSAGSTNVVVMALDQNGNPIEDVRIKAKVNGRNATVKPSSDITDENGEAEFDVRFVTFRKISSVMFSSDGVETTVEQE